MCILNTNVCMIRMSVIFFSRHAFCNTFSTHDLSWRSTKTERGQHKDRSFSTHDLSWRSTVQDYNDTSKKIFQLTTSRGGRLAENGELKKRLDFQLTTSRGGRPGQVCIYSLLSFSTHDLSWRSTLLLR